MKQINDHLLISAADFTGHGLHSAFMSLLGNAFLNKTVNHGYITKGF